MEESSRTKCSKVGESYCYKILQTYLNINDGVFGTTHLKKYVFNTKKNVFSEFDDEDDEESDDDGAEDKDKEEDP